MRRPNPDSPSASASPYLQLPDLLDLGPSASPAMPATPATPTTRAAVARSDATLLAELSPLGQRVYAMHKGSATESMAAFGQVRVGFTVYFILCFTKIFSFLCDA